MKRLMLTLAGAALTAASMASSTIVHDNSGHQYDNGAGVMMNTYQHSYAPGVITNGSTNERGYEVLLAGPAVLTGMLGSYVSYFNTGGGFPPPTGAETFRVRLYAEDGAAVSSGAPYAYSVGAPTTILYDSGQIPMVYFGSQMFSIKLPNVAVPANFAYTCKPEGFLQDTANLNSTWGQQLCGPPTTGPATKHALWRRNEPAAAWQLVGLSTYNGGPPTGVGGNIYGNMFGRFWTGCGPADPYVVANAYEDWDTNPLGQVIYNNDSAEHGDDVTLEGWRRTSTGIELGYVADVAAPTGTEAITVTLYPLLPGVDPTELSSIPDLANPIATATLTGFDVTAGAHVMTVPFTSNVTLPDRFVYTVLWGGSLTQGTAGNECGLLLGDQANSGGSQVAGFWGIALGAPVGYWYGNPWFDLVQFGDATAGTYNNFYANFMAAFDVVATPLSVPFETAATSTGSTFAGTNANINADDGSYWELRPGVVFSSSFDPLAVDFMAHMPCNDMTALNFKATVRASVGRIRLGYKLATYPGGTFSAAGTPATPVANPAGGVFDGSNAAQSLPFGAGPADVTVTIPVPVANIGDASTRYETKIRLQCKAMAAVFSYPWRLMIDEAHWEVTP